MTDASTQRTDALCPTFDEEAGSWGGRYTEAILLCRTLERELTASRSRLADLERQLAERGAGVSRDARKFVNSWLWQEYYSGRKTTGLAWLDAYQEYAASMCVDCHASMLAARPQPEPALCDCINPQSCDRFQGADIPHNCRIEAGKEFAQQASQAVEKQPPKPMGETPAAADTLEAEIAALALTVTLHNDGPADEIARDAIRAWIAKHGTRDQALADAADADADPWRKILPPTSNIDWIKGRDQALLDAAKVCRQEKRKWMAGNATHSISDFDACAQAIDKLRSEG